jgi:hypothetical protein
VRVDGMANRMVFVVGAPRSGTTWLQRALSVHPDVLVLPSETHLFSWGLSTLREQVQGGLVTSPSTGTWFMPREDFRRAARAFADAAFGGYVDRTRPEALRVVERSPSHVWHLGLIADVYPDAWVVHIVRDGRDVARSLMSQSWGPAEIGPAARVWAGAVRAARAAAPTVPRYLEVRYEDLLAEPARFAEVFDFVGLPPLDAAMSQAELEAGRAVNVDPMRPEVASGKWRDEWSAADLEGFEEAAGDVLASAGYPQLTARPSTAQGRAGRRSKPPPLALDMEIGQRLLDRLLEDFAVGTTTTLDERMTDDVAIRSRQAGESWVLLGRAGLARLRAELSAWGTPCYGDQQIAGRTWTLALGHRAHGGPLTERLVQVTLTPDARIAELRLTVFDGTRV